MRSFKPTLPVCLLLGLLSASVAATALAGATPPGHAALFVGNSYSGANYPNHLGKSYGHLVSEGQPQLDPIVIETLSPGGYTLAGHFADAQGQSSLADFLTDQEPDHMWNSVVLQEQSQTPAFPQTMTEWQDSRDAAVGLAQMIDARGADVRLLMTYGRRNGDIGPNASRFPDFGTMNGLLTLGYEAYAAAILAAGIDVTIIPAGIAWAKVYDDEVTAGNDPLGGGSLFARLYRADGSHPSALGTYLMGCLAYVTIQDAPCAGLLWAHNGMSQAHRNYLQGVADWTLATYIQPSQPPGDDDDAGDDDDSTSDDDDDTADDDDSATDDDDDTADDDDDDDSVEGDDDDDTGDGGDDRSSCSCNQQPGPSEPAPGATASLLVLCLTLPLRRRR